MFIRSLSEFYNCYRILSLIEEGAERLSQIASLGTRQQVVANDAFYGGLPMIPTKGRPLFVDEKLRVFLFLSH